MSPRPNAIVLATLLIGLPLLAVPTAAADHVCQPLEPPWSCAHTDPCSDATRPIPDPLVRAIAYTACRAAVRTVELVLSLVPDLVEG